MKTIRPKKPTYAELEVEVRHAQHQQFQAYIALSAVLESRIDAIGVTDRDAINIYRVFRLCGATRSDGGVLIVTTHIPDQNPLVALYDADRTLNVEYGEWHRRWATECWPVLDAMRKAWRQANELDKAAA